MNTTHHRPLRTSQSSRVYFNTSHIIHRPSRERRQKPTSAKWQDSNVTTITAKELSGSCYLWQHCCPISTTQNGSRGEGGGEGEEEKEGKRKTGCVVFLLLHPTQDKNLKPKLKQQETEQTERPSALALREAPGPGSALRNHDITAYATLAPSQDPVYTATAQCGLCGD